MPDLHVGERVRNVRLALGLTQGQFAKALSVTTSYISQVENSIEKSPSDRLLRLIQVLYRVDENWLWHGTDPKPIFDFTPAEPAPDVAPLDPRLHAMNVYLAQAWAGADEDAKGWIVVQFRRAFPDFIYGREKTTDYDEPAKP